MLYLWGGDELSTREMVDIETHQRHHLRMLFPRRCLGSAPYLEEEAYVGDTDEDGADGDERLPTAHQRPDDCQKDVEQQHGEESVGQHRRQHALRGRDNPSERRRNQPQRSEYIEY